MRLLSVDIENYKRFEKPSTLEVDGPLVAIVGPNEAGKTSLLKAIEHLSRNEAFDRTEFTGRQEPGNQPVVSALFAIEPADLAVPTGVGSEETVGDLLGDPEAFSFRLEKRPNQGPHWTLDPALHRDLTSRTELVARLASAVEAESLVVPSEAEEEPDDRTLHEQVEATRALLADADEDLSPPALAALEELGTALANHQHEAGLDEDDPVATLAAGCQALADVERRRNPNALVGDALTAQTPAFLLFDEDHRHLASEYDWHAIGDEPPAALANLCAAADVNFHDYKAIAIDPARVDELDTLEHNANERLEKVFAAWTQSGVSVRFRAGEQLLRLHAWEVSKAIPFDQRSAGFRMFAALIAFTRRYAGAVPPVLLIDEAETHLHYGGQADLVQVFERQDVAQAIIYTTHSVGCLPEDLGTTIRGVTQVGDERSEVLNGFWEANATGAGLTPLMLAMGAEVLAFTPARYALIGEGPTEAIILPSMFRDVRDPKYDDRPIGFQVAPGVARVSAASAAGLELDAGKVAYLVDADEGGLNNADKLAEAVHAEDRLFILGDSAEHGLCTEDFIDLELYVEAVNDVLGDVDGDPLKIEDLGNVSRPSGVEAWCADRDIDAPSKTAVALKALALARSRPDARLVSDETRRQQLSQLYESIREVLAVDA